MLSQYIKSIKMHSKLPKSMIKLVNLKLKSKDYLKIFSSMINSVIHWQMDMKINNIPLIIKYNHYQIFWDRIKTFIMKKSMNWKKLIKIRITQSKDQRKTLLHLVLLKETIKILKRTIEKWSHLQTKIINNFMKLTKLLVRIN